MSCMISFHFGNVGFTLSANYQLSQSTTALSTIFTLYGVLYAFDNVTVLFNSVVTPYVHLLTSSLTIYMLLVCILQSLKFVRDYSNAKSISTITK